MKYTKFIFTSIITVILLLSSVSNSYASSDETDNAYEHDGAYYLETYIEGSDTIFPINPISTSSTTKYITKTKTTNYRDNSDNIIWTLSITATFSYDGSTVNCISCTPKATVYSSYWSIKTLTSSKTSNSATANGTFIFSPPLLNSSTFSKSVTIYCTPTGTVY